MKTPFLDPHLYHLNYHAGFEFCIRFLCLRLLILRTKVRVSGIDEQTSFLPGLIQVGSFQMAEKNNLFKGL